MSRVFLSAVFLQFLGTIGSGIFVLPYVFYHSNFIFATLFLVFLGIITSALNQFYCYIVTHTKGDHQLAGYARLYLSPQFSRLAFLNLIILSFGAITAYSKLFSSFLSALLPTVAPFAKFIYLILLIIFFISKSKLLSRLSFIISLLTILIPIFLFYRSLSFSYIPNTVYQSPSFLFYGATLFALSGFTIIPEIDELLRRGRHYRPQQLPFASLLGMVLVLIIYFIFAFSVVSLSGDHVSVDTVSGILSAQPFLAKLISLFGLIVTFRASYGFLIILHELFFRDLKFSSFHSSLLSLLFPLLSLFTTSVSLLAIISLTGTITIFVSALLICLIRLKLPTTFWTLFFAILIMLSLTIGLIMEFI